MKTHLLYANKATDMDIAKTLLMQGELVAVPTETVYGLAADASNPLAVEKIFIAKGRPINHPLIVHIASAEQISNWAKEVPDTAYILAEAFWPGPVTLIVKKAPAINTTVTGRLETIALRVPNHPVLKTLLTKMDVGLAAPSANLHKRISPTSAKHVIDNLNGKIAAVLDGGSCDIGIESTIVDLTTSIPRILRPGPITAKMIEATLNCRVQFQAYPSERVPGNMLAHYQPHAKSLLLNVNEIYKYTLTYANDNDIIAVMHYSSLPKIIPQKNIKLHIMPSNKEGYAKNLYQSLFVCDAYKPALILIESPPDTSEWADVNDRLSKATTNL